MDNVLVNKVVNHYCGNGMANLKPFCQPLIKKFGGICDADYDDFYSAANETVWSAMRRYDCTKNDNVEAYLRGAILNKFKDIMSKKNRDRRIPSSLIVSMEITIDEESTITIGETLRSDKMVDDEIDELNGNESIIEFLNGLSKKQRAIVQLIMDGYKKESIVEILHIKPERYDTCMAMLRNTNTMILLSHRS